MTPRDLSRAIIASPNQSSTVFGLGGANPIRQKSLFVMRFLRRVGEGGEDWRNGMTFLVKSIERPSVQPQTEEINQYNKKRVIHTGVKYTPVSCTLYDTADGAAQVLWAQYASYYFGDYRQEPGSYRDDIINERMNDPARAGYGYGIARTNASEPQGINSQFFFDNIEVFQVWGGEYVAYRLLNPKIASFTPDDLDYEQNAPATVTMSLQYEGIYHENGGRPSAISNNQALVELFRGQFSGNTFDPVGSQVRQNSFTSTTPNTLPRIDDNLARALAASPRIEPAALELDTLPTSSGGTLNRFGTFAFGDFSTLGTNLPSEISTMVGNQEETAGVLGQDASDIPDVANAINFAANATGESPSDLASFDQTFFNFDPPPSDDVLPVPAPNNAVVTEDKTKQRRGLSLSPVVMAAVNSRSDGTSQIGKRAPTRNTSLRFVKEPTPVRNIVRPLVFGRIAGLFNVSALITGTRGIQPVIASASLPINILGNISARMLPSGFVNTAIQINSNITGRVEPRGAINTNVIVSSNARGFLRVSGTINSPIVVRPTISGRTTPAGIINGQVRITNIGSGAVPILRSSISASVVIRGAVRGVTPIGGFILTPVRINGALTTAVEVFATLNRPVVITGSIVGRPVVSGTINRPIVISANISAQSISGAINGITRITSQIDALTSWGNLNGQVIVNSQIRSDTTPSATIQAAVSITGNLSGIASPASVLSAPVIVSLVARGEQRFGILNAMVRPVSNISVFVFPVADIDATVVVQPSIVGQHRFGQINGSIIISANIETLAIAPRVGSIFAPVAITPAIFAARPITASSANQIVISMESSGVSVVAGNLNRPVVVNCQASATFTLRRLATIAAPITITSSGLLVATVSGELVGNTIVSTQNTFALIPVNGPVDASVVVGCNSLGGVVLQSDPVFEDVIFLLQPNGINGSTIFDDASTRDNIITSNGQAQMDTSIRRYSAASLYIADATDDNLTVANDIEFTLPQSFTVEAFVRFATLSSDAALMGKWGSAPSNTSWLLSIEDDDLRFTFVTPANDTVFVSYDWTTRQTDTWYHIAVTRDSSDRLRLFIDGLEVSAITDAGIIRDSTADFVIGDLVGVPNYGFDGYMDQVRITTNNARYTSNFLVPISGFPTTSGNIVEFVGAKSYTQVAGEEKEITFDNLSGGIDTIARSGDTCIIHVIHGREQAAGANIVLTQNPSNFETFGPFLANDTNSVETLVAIKELFGPPPTTTRVRGPATNSTGIIQIMVFRNVASFAFHAPIYSATASNTNRPTPPASYISRTGTSVVTMGGGSVPTGMPLYDDPLELTYVNKLNTNGPEKNQVMSLVGFARDPAPGNNFNFARWTHPSASYTESLTSSIAVSFALEPRALATELPSLPLTTDIRYWFRADRDVYTDLPATTSAADGQRIAVWGNQGTQEDAIQSDVDARPSLEVDLGVNRLPSVRAFDGYFEDLLEVNQPTGLTTTRTFTAFFVVDRLPTGFTSPNPILGRSGDKASIFFRNVNGQNIQFWKTGVTFGQTDLPFYIVGVSLTGLTNYRSSLNAPNTTFSVGGNAASNSGTTIPFLTDPLDWTTTGVRNIFQGNIYEFIYYNGALSSTDYESVNQYLLSRYTPRIDLTDPSVFNGSTVEQDDACASTALVIGEVDPFWNYTSVLVSGTGEDGSPIFADRSRYRRSAIAGGAAQNDFDIVVGTVPSIKHAAYGDHIRREYGPELDISGPFPDFCMEAYVVCDDPTAFNTLLGRRRDNDNYWIVVTNNRLQFATFSGVTATNRLDVAADLVAGQQHHIAVIRVGQTYYGFVDGVLKGSNTSTTTMALSTNTDLYLGESDTNISRYWRGNTNWFRMTIGRSRYSITGFTPPSLPLAEEAPALLTYPAPPPMSEVVLLADFETPTTSAYVDESPTRRLATFFGNARIELDSRYEGGRSLFLDGSGDYISFADSTDLRTEISESGKFTMEAWIKVPSVSTGKRTIASKRASAGAGGLAEFTLSVNNGQPTFILYNGASGAPRVNLRATYPTAPQIQANTWHHIAVCGDGGFYTLFLDGQLIQSATRVAAPATNTSALIIGRDPWDGTSVDWLGWIDEFRYTKGRVIYEDSFVLPVTQFPHPEYLDLSVQEESDTVVAQLTIPAPPVRSNTSGYGLGYGSSWGSGLVEEDDTVSASGTII